MKTAAPPGRLAEPGTAAEAVIREARRRQRRRRLVIGLAVAALLAGASGVVAGVGPPGVPRRVSHPRPTPPGPAVRRLALPGPIPRSVATTVLMWPVGYPLFGPNFGPPAYLDDLATRQLSQRRKPTFAAGDFRPYLVRTGHWLVYVGGAGTMAIRDDLVGRPRVLGSTAFFAAAASPGRVWLERFRGGYLGQGPASVWQVSVRDGHRGAVITLPHRTALVAGTDAGLLLEVPQATPAGPDFGLALWTPGGPLRVLPHAPLWGYGVDVTPRLVAYGTGCADRDTAADPTYYATCRMLRVFDVVTGRLLSFRKPPGTAGWMPPGLFTAQAIAPLDGMIAAYAATRPLGQGQGRLFVIRLTSAIGRPLAVPSSTARLDPRTAWSAGGSWLFYQGPGRRLWAYEVSRGKIRASSTPCCSYTVMAAFPSARR